MGRWYEIASFPSFFQPKNGVDTRATYTLRPDGNFSVLNEVWVNGRRKSISGIAYKADPRSDEAKLKVRFRIPPDLPFVPVVGDYWVLYVDDGYQNAVVGHPTRRFLWVCFFAHLSILCTIDQFMKMVVTHLLTFCLDADISGLSIHACMALM